MCYSVHCGRSNNVYVTHDFTTYYIYDRTIDTEKGKYWIEINGTGMLWKLKNDFGVIYSYFLLQGKKSDSWRLSETMAWERLQMKIISQKVK